MKVIPHKLPWIYVFFTLLYGCLSSSYMDISILSTYYLVFLYAYVYRFEYMFSHVCVHMIWAGIYICSGSSDCISQATELKLSTVPAQILCGFWVCEFCSSYVCGEYFIKRTISTATLWLHCYGHIQKHSSTFISVIEYLFKI